MSDSDTTLIKDAVMWTLTCNMCGKEVVADLLPVDPYILLDEMQRHPCLADRYNERDRTFALRMLEGRMLRDE